MAGTVGVACLRFFTLTASPDWWLNPGGEKEGGEAGLGGT